MDNFQEEPTYHCFTIKNEDSDIDVEELLDLPSTEEDSNNQEFFYLTLENDVKEEDEPQEQSSETQFLPTFGFIQEDLSESNLKLIALEDGRMFVTTETDQPKDSDPSTAAELNSVEQFQIIPAEDNTDMDNTDAETAYQLMQLSDGSQALLKVVKVKNAEHIEEQPKKIKKFPCDFEGCNKEYTTSYHRSVHQRTHTDCKPYKCTMQDCTKCFSTNYSLKAHIRTHTGEKPYSCSLCTKQFKTSGDLQKHVRIHTGEKPFQCPIAGCGRFFTTSNIRKVHIRSHTGERPYSCTYPYCNKAFTSSTNYKNHLRIHSGEKPYVCSVEGCGKKFTEYSSLYKHNAVHQPFKLRACMYCGQKFKQESGLTLHKRVKHNVLVTKGGTDIIVSIE